MAKRKKILVTGSGGFIFGNFIRQVFYAKLPYTISSIDRVRDSHIIHNIYVNQDHSFYVADITEPHILHVIFEKERPDIVIHGAAERNINTMVSSNLVGTQNIINECLKIDARMIFVSSCRVYGEMKSEHTDPYEEQQQMNPKGTFAATKAAGELLVKAAKGLKYNIVRLSDNYGPWQTSGNLIPHIINSILENQDINIYGSGYQTRDWTHVFDTCSAILTIIDNGTNEETYNVTSKQEFSNIEVAQIICNTIGKGHELIKHVEKDVDIRFAMSNDKIKAHGWSPEMKLRDGIAQTYEWYMKNKWALKM